MNHPTLVLAINRNQFKEYARTVPIERIEYVDSHYRLRGVDNFVFRILPEADKRHDFRDIVEFVHTRRGVKIEDLRESLVRR